MSSQERPKYRCAAEWGQLPAGSEIFFAKHDYQVGVGQRAEEGDEFYFDGKPGRWMEAINDAARERVQELVDQKKRKSAEPEIVAQNTPIQPPRSGFRALTDKETFKDGPQATPDVLPQNAPLRPAPRRRAKAN